MSQTLIVLFTGVIAASTLVYSFYSIRLWKATRSSADIARFTAFMSLLTQLVKYIEDAKREGKPEAVFLDQLGVMIAEFGFDRFLSDIDFKKDKDAREYFAKIEGLLRGHNIDPDSVPILKTAFRKIKDGA